ncbi:hypothetical protein [Nocardia farcinica]|uniref:hypothetical protein n=1 Tax=Nocardia farcinica TaxID=37329 RepID=UPI0010C955D5|nr:hypothetical protein [Nocardia farcinica]
MSDRSVEDEIVSEISRFSVAMRAAISRHAQAANWLERRRARKEISRLVRTERREADQARTHHKTWTAQAVERYRVHARPSPSAPAIRPSTTPAGPVTPGRWPSTAPTWRACSSPTAT